MLSRRPGVLCGLGRHAGMCMHVNEHVHDTSSATDLTVHARRLASMRALLLTHRSCKRCASEQ
jgi:hypothetical protein